MYVTQWGLSVQQALPKRFVGTLSYVGSKSTNLLDTTYINLKDPLAGLRPYPTFGKIQGRGNRNNSSYQGLSRACSARSRVGCSYTYAHEIDQDAAGGGDSDSDFPQNPACPILRAGLGRFRCAAWI
jgi:hypothetical protein